MKNLFVSEHSLSIKFSGMSAQLTAHGKGLRTDDCAMNVCDKFLTRASSVIIGASDAATWPTFSTFARQLPTAHDAFGVIPLLSKRS